MVSWDHSYLPLYYVWFWVDNQKKVGYQLARGSFRVNWSSSDLITGILATIIA